MIREYMKSEEDENKNGNKGSTNIEIFANLLIIAIALLFLVLLIRKIKSGEQATEETNITTGAQKTIIEEINENYEVIHNDVTISEFEINNGPLENNQARDLKLSNSENNNFEKIIENSKDGSGNSYEVLKQCQLSTINDFEEYLIAIYDKLISSNGKIEPVEFQEIIKRTTNFINGFEQIIKRLANKEFSDEDSSKIKDKIMDILKLGFFISSEYKYNPFNDKEFILKLYNLLKSIGITPDLVEKLCPGQFMINFNN